MKLIELKRRIESSIVLNSRAEESEVAIIVSNPGSIGPTPSVLVSTADLGFDWDAGKFLIKPSAPLEVLQPSSGAALKVGDVLHGYCNGFFDRDSYSDKTVLAFGDTWVTAREEQGFAVTANFINQRERDNYTERWKHGVSVV